MPDKRRMLAPGCLIITVDSYDVSSDPLHGFVRREGVLHATEVLYAKW